MLTNTAKLLRAVLAILLPSARGNATVFKVVRLIIGLLKSAGSARPSAHPMSAPKTGPAITYVSSLAENDDDQVPANANSLEVDSEDVSLQVETEPLAGIPGLGQLSTMSAHWDLASMAKCDDEEDADTIGAADKAVSDHTVCAIPEADEAVENMGRSEESDAGEEEHMHQMLYRRRRLDVIAEVDEEEYDEDDITPGIPAGDFEEYTDSLNEASSSLLRVQEHGQLVSASAHWDLASLLQCDEDDTDEDDPCIVAHVIEELPSSPATRSSRRLSTIMEADDEADDEADSDDELHCVSSEHDEGYPPMQCADEGSAEEELDAPIPSVIFTTPSSKTIAHRAFPVGEESTVADMSGLAPSTDPPCSPTPSECSSVDSPMPLTPSTDFDTFRFPTMVTLSPRIDDAFPTADCLFEGIPSSISFSKLIASPASDEVIRTADCLFQGIPSLGSYETLYLKSSDPPVPEINAPPPRTSSIVNPSISHGPCIRLPAAPVPSTSTAGNGGYIYHALILGCLAFWLRISVLLSFLFRFFSSS